MGSNINATCQSCMLCSNAEYFNGRSLIYGDSEKNSLLIGGYSDLEFFVKNKDEFFSLIPENTCFTFTLRCLFPNDKTQFPSNLGRCGIYSRVVTYAFSSFYLVKEAWDQLGLTSIGEFAISNKWVDTPIGWVYCLGENWRTKHTNYFPAAPLSKKTVRKGVLG